MTLSILHRIRRQSKISVLKALDCRNVIQVIQDGKYIKYNFYNFYINNGLNETVTVEEKRN